MCEPTNSETSKRWAEFYLAHSLTVTPTRTHSIHACGLPSNTTPTPTDQVESLEKTKYRAYNTKTQHVPPRRAVYIQHRPVAGTRLPRPVCYWSRSSPGSMISDLPFLPYPPTPRSSPPFLLLHHSLIPYWAIFISGSRSTYHPLNSGLPRWMIVW